MVFVTVGVPFTPYVTAYLRTVCDSFWAPRPNGPVNKMDLSTGENGELASEVALGGLLARFADAPRLVLRRVTKSKTHAKCWG